jgi:hypothetical protein
MKKSLKLPVILGFFSVVLIAAGWRLITGMSKEASMLRMASLPEMQELERDKVNLQRAGIALQRAKIRNSYELIPAKNKIYFGSLLALVGVSCASGLILSFYFGHAKLREKSIVEQQVGSSMLKVHYSTLKKPEFMLYVSQVNEIEGLRAQFPEKALRMSLALSAAITAQMKAIAGRRGLLGGPVIDAIPTEAPPAIMQHAIPSFRDLLLDGTIDAGNPLVFGFADGEQITGTWQDLFSCAVGGRAGSGKTSTLRSIVCQSVLQGCEFLLIDPHFPHEDSLQASLKPLIETGHVTVDLPINVLKTVNRAINHRIKGKEPDNKPLILVIDELLSLMPKLPGTAETIFNVGTEGRKVKVYGLFSGHSWQAKRTGGDTAIRDNLTAIFAHNMKPKQAQMLLQDADLSSQVNALRTGQAVFAPVNADPRVVSVPFCTVKDVKMVAEMITETRKETTSKPEETNHETNGETHETETHETNDETSQVSGGFQGYTLLPKVQKLCDKFTLPKVAESAGVNKGNLSQVLRGGKPLSESMRIKLEMYVREAQL